MSVKGKFPGYTVVSLHVSTLEGEDINCTEGTGTDTVLLPVWDAYSRG